MEGAGCQEGTACYIHTLWVGLVTWAARVQALIINMTSTIRI